jgi:hypothetical protein
LAARIAPLSAVSGLHERPIRLGLFSFSPFQEEERNGSLRMVGITVEIDRAQDRLVTITVNPKLGDSSVDSVDSDAKSLFD